MFLLVALLALCPSGVWSQFPTPCTTAQALKDRRCCPQWKDGSMCGVESGRGSCRFIHQSQTREKSLEQSNDDRLDWPHEYFDSMCVCIPPYDGFDCGGCVPDLTGDNCDKKRKLVRSEIRQLSPKERLKVFSYLSLAKMKKSARFRIMSAGNRHDRATFRFHEASVYDVGAWMRYYAYKPILQNNRFNFSTTFATRGPAFLTWNRWHLAFMEREIQIITGDDNFTIPYYDWSRDGSHCAVCTDDFMGKSDSQGVLTRSSYFANWKSICSGYYYDYKYCPVAEDECKMEPLQRSPGADPSFPSLPTAADVDATLNWKTYDTPPYDTRANHSFRNALEGFISPSDGVTQMLNMHSRVLSFMGGSMSQDTICSADPLFILHQANVDKIFESWIQKQGATSAKYPKSGIPGQDPEENIVPSMPPKMNKVFLNKAETFGYTYSKYP